MSKKKATKKPKSPKQTLVTKVVGAQPERIEQAIVDLRKAGYTVKHVVPHVHSTKNLGQIVTETDIILISEYRRKTLKTPTSEKPSE